jgi:death-on-curing protein
MATSFLSLDEVLAIHAHQIDRYGGSPGIRDVRLLESALAMPEATFSGEDLHPTLHEKAAAYLFHVVKNHPFVDGNKRAGLAVCLVFLALNGRRVRATDDDLVDLVLGVAKGELGKPDVAVFLKARSRGPRREARVAKKTK